MAKNKQEAKEISIEEAEAQLEADAQEQEAAPIGKIKAFGEEVEFYYRPLVIHLSMMRKHTRKKDWGSLIATMSEVVEYCFDTNASDVMALYVDLAKKTGEEPFEELSELIAELADDGTVPKG